MISIVIPNYNGKTLLEKNLPAVFRAARSWGGKFELIVVDDASGDDSVSFLKKNYPQVKLIIHEKNQRFAVSCNDGVKAALGEIVILLNTDVVPEQNFLKPLLFHFQDEEVFAVGCQEKSITARKIIYSGRSLAKFKRGFLIHWRAGNQQKSDTFWVASGSAAYRKSIWEKLGGMDPLYYPAYWEDIDISYRAQKAGYKVIFEPKSVVFHQHETTNLIFLGKRIMEIIAFKNQILFVWKNITDLDLLISHFFWLPYHMLFGSWETKGLFLLGFIKALLQLPEVVNSRIKAQRFFKLTDNEILSQYA